MFKLINKKADELSALKKKLDVELDILKEHTKKSLLSDANLMADSIVLLMDKVATNECEIARLKRRLFLLSGCFVGASIGVILNCLGL